MTHNEHLYLKINRINAFIGRSVAILILIMVLFTFANTILRYFFSLYSTAVAESVLIMNAMVFMLGASYTLQTNHHVRVDVIYGHLSARKKALFDLIGSLLFLLPFCVFILFYSYPYVGLAWQVKEPSAAVGGLPGLYLVKTIIPITAILLLIQALGEIIRNLLIIGHRH